MAKFANPSGLKAVDANINIETGASGGLKLCIPGTGNTGELIQGSLEMSNVDVLREQMQIRMLKQWHDAIVETMDVITTTTHLMRIKQALKKEAEKKKK